MDHTARTTLLLCAALALTTACDDSRKRAQSKPATPTPATTSGQTGGALAKGVKAKEHPAVRLKKTLAAICPGARHNGEGFLMVGCEGKLSPALTKTLERVGCRQPLPALDQEDPKQPPLRCARRILTDFDAYRTFGERLGAVCPDATLNSHTLSLHRCSIQRGDALTALLDTPAPIEVRGLSFLKATVEDEAFGKLVRDDMFRKLFALSVHDTPLGDGAATALAGLRLPVREVSVRGKTLSPAGFVRWMGGEGFDGVVIFRAAGAEGVDDDALRAFATRKPCAKLAALDLASTAITDEGLRALSTRCLKTKRLWGLGLRGTAASDAGVIAVLKAHQPDADTRRSFDLADTKITDATLEAVRAAPGRWKLLHLGGTAVTDAGVSSLATLGARFPGGLCLRGTKVSDSALRALATSKAPLQDARGARLKTLDLRSTAATDAGVRALLASPSGAGLMHLLVKGASGLKGFKAPPKPALSLKDGTWPAPACVGHHPL